MAAYFSPSCLGLMGKFCSSVDLLFQVLFKFFFHRWVTGGLTQLCEWLSYEIPISIFSSLDHLTIARSKSFIFLKSNQLSQQFWEKVFRWVVRWVVRQVVRWVVRCLFTLVKCIEISSYLYKVLKYLVTFFPKTIEVSRNFSKFIELSNKISQYI